MTIRQRPELSPLSPQPPGGGQPQPGQPARIPPQQPPPQQPPQQQRPQQPLPNVRPPQQQQQPGTPAPRPPAAPPRETDPDVPIEGGAPARAAAAPPGGLNPKIHSFGGYGGGRHEDKWKRSPNTTGSGATHVRSFHCKLAEDSLTYLDQQINEWLDAHPQYEVKFVTVTVGEWTGKTKEQNLIMHVWV